MDRYETKYKRNKSIFKNGSAPQLTILGDHRHHPDLKVEMGRKVDGLVDKVKISSNYSV